MGLTGAGAAATVPIVARGRHTGVLAVIGVDSGPDIGPAELQCLQILADVVAVSLDRNGLMEHVTAAYEEVQRQSELVDHISDAIISISLDDRVASWSAAAERIYGYAGGEAVGDLFMLLATRLQGTDGGQVGVEAALAEATRSGEWRGELRERSLHGGELQLLASIVGLTDDAGEPSGFIIVNRDMTEHRRKEHQADHDALTGLPNRASMTKQLQRAVQRAATGGHRLAVMFLDLNGFKQVNDRFGHEAGDEVLRETARRLSPARCPATTTCSPVSAATSSSSSPRTSATSAHPTWPGAS